MTQSGFAELNGARLYYEIAGSGEPLVFIHGFSLDTRMWDDQWEFFARRYRVIRYDVRGFGKSSLPGMEPYAQADDLKALLEHLPAAPAHIVGLSMGGRIALDFAAAYPELARSLIPVDTTLGGFTSTSKKDWGLPGALARSAGVTVGKNHWLSEELFAPANEQPRVAARLREMVEDYSGYHWTSRDPGRWSDAPAIRRLDQIRALTLVVVGERDLPDFHAIADLLAEQIPNARKVVIGGAGHLVNMEAPEEFNEVVLNFLREIS